MRGTSTEETLHTKETHEYLVAIHGYRVCVYRADNGRFSETRFNKAITIFRQKIRFCGVVYHHQNAIVEHRIK